MKAWAVTAAAMMFFFGSLPTTAHEVMVGKHKATGRHAKAQPASGWRPTPIAFWVEIRANPRQHVEGTWAMECKTYTEDGTGVIANTRQGTFSGKTPIYKKMGLAQSNPDECYAVATGTLQKRGTIRGWLWMH